MYLPGRILKRRCSTYPAGPLAFCCLLLVSCATTPDGTPRQPRKTLECPAHMIMICESRREPSSASDEEIPDYERCICRPAPN